MRLPWTNRPLATRLTPPILSAAILLAGCEQATGPAALTSRPGGGILADAQAGTVSAKGSGQVATTVECGFLTPGVCTAGGRGAEFSFDFTAPNSGFPATGTFSVKFRDTGDVIQFASGSAAISTSQHILFVFAAVCNVTTAAGTFSGVCSLDARDNGQPSSGDAFNLTFGTFPVFPFAEARDPVISGGMQID